MVISHSGCRPTGGSRCETSAYNPHHLGQDLTVCVLITSVLRFSQLVQRVKLVTLCLQAWFPKFKAFTVALRTQVISISVCMLCTNAYVYSWFFCLINYALCNNALIMWYCLDRHREIPLFLVKTEVGKDSMSCSRTLQQVWACVCMSSHSEGDEFLYVFISSHSNWNNKQRLSYLSQTLHTQHRVLLYHFLLCDLQILVKKALEPAATLLCARTHTHTLRSRKIMLLLSWETPSLGANGWFLG